MEAMACGVPCVVSRIRGNTDLIVNGKGGMTNSPRDVRGFANALSKLYQNKDLSSAMSNYNLKAINSFSIEVVANQLFDIYKEESSRG